MTVGKLHAATSTMVLFGVIHRGRGARASTPDCVLVVAAWAWDRRGCRHMPNSRCVRTSATRTAWTAMSTANAHSTSLIKFSIIVTSLHVLMFV